MTGQRRRSAGAAGCRGTVRTSAGPRLSPGRVSGLAVAALTALSFAAAAEGPEDWRSEFPVTDFARHSVTYEEIVSDGTKRDVIPPIDNPKFQPAAEALDVGPMEPVLSIGINGDYRAYPLRILLWHEIVNDVVGGVPVLISYCPLCNSGVVFDRRVGGKVLEFGNTGRLRHFDMVMYDRQTESWWQQFLGKAVMGKMTGTSMKPLPARLESLSRFRVRARNGRVLVPNDAGVRPYGATPYVGMDTARVPRGLFPYDLPGNIPPLARVVVVGDEGWVLPLVRRERRIEHGDLVISWFAGQNSIHDVEFIANARDVGNVIVQRKTAAGLEDVPYDVTFAFAFAAFLPESTLHYEQSGADGRPP